MQHSACVDCDTAAGTQCNNCLCPGDPILLRIPVKNNLINCIICGNQYPPKAFGDHGYCESCWQKCGTSTNVQCKLCHLEFGRNMISKIEYCYTCRHKICGQCKKKFQNCICNPQPSSPHDQVTCRENGFITGVISPGIFKKCARCSCVLDKHNQFNDKMCSTCQYLDVTKNDKPHCTLCMTSYVSTPNDMGYCVGCATKLGYRTKCKICGAEVFGKEALFDMCQSCKNKYELCTTCNKYMTKNDIEHHYCPRVSSLYQEEFNSQRICKRCFQGFTHTKDPNNCCCDECYGLESMSRCVRCNNTTYFTYGRGNNDLYCSRCYEISLCSPATNKTDYRICVSCGIQFVKHTSDKYCPHCYTQSETQECIRCFRKYKLIESHSVQYCADCFAIIGVTAGGITIDCVRCTKKFQYSADKSKLYCDECYDTYLNFDNICINQDDHTTQKPIGGYYCYPKEFNTGIIPMGTCAKCTKKFTYHENGSLLYCNECYSTFIGLDSEDDDDPPDQKYATQDKVGANYYEPKPLNTKIFGRPNKLMIECDMCFGTYDAAEETCPHCVKMNMHEIICKYQDVACICCTKKFKQHVDSTSSICPSCDKYICKKCKRILTYMPMNGLCGACESQQSAAISLPTEITSARCTICSESCVQNDTDICEACQSAIDMSVNKKIIYPAREPATLNIEYISKCGLCDVPFLKRSMLECDVCARCQRIRKEKPNYMPPICDCSSRWCIYKHIAREYMYALVDNANAPDKCAVCGADDDTLYVRKDEYRILCGKCVTIA